MKKIYTNAKTRFSFDIKLLKRNHFVLIALFTILHGNSLYAQSPSIFTSSGTWVCPRGVNSITVEAWGGGAGGTATPGTNNANGGGGGGGAYAKRNIVTVIPGTTYTITVGTGGASNTNGTLSTATFGLVTITAAAGSTGTSSTITNGIGGIGGLVAASQGDLGLVFAGGNGGNGTFKPSGNNSGSGGGGGSGAGTSGIGNSGSGITPGGVKSNSGGAGGNGGADANGTAAPVVVGNYGGGGGGGGHKGKNGGVGQPGAIIITFTCPNETADAGIDQVVCGATTTTTLAGNAPVSPGLNGTWTRTSGTGNITSINSATSGITGLVVGSATFRWTINNGRCSTTFDNIIVTRTSTPPTVITPNPINASTGLCYTGGAAITSILWATSAGATSYDVYFGAGILPITITSNVNTNNYSTGTLLPNTTYYWRIVAKNSCGVALTSATWSFTTKSSPCYCIPAASSGVHGTGITNVSYSSVNNTTSNTTVYNDYTSLIGNVIQGATMPISITTATGNKKYNIKIWVDWNNDGDFIDLGEEMFSGIVNSNTINGTVSIALTATLGYHAMRIGIAENKNGGGNEIPTPCFNGNRGAYEDYTINVTAAAVCTLSPTITTNPSNSGTANGANTSFTVTFANLPTSFVWEVSSDGGTNYNTITNGGVYSTATTATLTLTAANASMNNFRYRVSASNACGTSVVSTAAILTVNVTYCAVGSSSLTYFISGITSEGNLNDTSNSPTTYSVGGYGNFSNITIAKQVPGGGINIKVNLSGGVQFIRSYVDWNGDGVFADPGEQVYSSGGVAAISTSFGFVVPTSLTQGNYRMRIRTRSFTESSTIAPCGTYTTGETEDYTLAIVPDCAALIDSVVNGSFCGANNPVTMNAVGLGGTTSYRWYTTLTGGVPESTTTLGNYAPTLSSTKIYFVTAVNSSCESLVRTRVIAKIIPITTINFTPTSPTTCGEDTIITINATSSNIDEEELFVEDFEGSIIGLTATMPTNTNAGAESAWNIKSSTFQSTSTAVWKPAINSGSIGSNFAFSTSDYSAANIVTRYTTTSSFNTNNFLDLTLTFNIYFSHYGNAGENVKVQISEDGLLWSDLVTYTTDQGTASQFKAETLILPIIYLNKNTISFRFQYTSGGWADGFAIDDIRFYGSKQLNPTFTWTSTSAITGYTDPSCTLPFLYTNQAVSTIYLKPDISQLEVATFPITVTTTLANGCPISKVITVTNNSSIWKGTDILEPTNWNVASNWLPAVVPTANNCVIIPSVTNDPEISGTNYNGYGNTLTILNGGKLEIESDNNLIITDFVNVNSGGTFNIGNSASLIQINDNAINSGDVFVKRTSRPMFRWDYVYHGSPVAGNIISQIPLDYDLKYKYVTNKTITGLWTPLTTTSAGDGFITRVRNIAPFNVTPTTIDFTYTGVPNNGIVTTSGTTYDGGLTTAFGNSKLLANPYPCAIDATLFLDDPTNKLYVGGTLYLWTSTTVYSGTGPYNVGDYVTWNKTGGTIGLPPPGLSFNGKIASGQGFMVQMIADGPIVFKNYMRTINFNNTFYRHSKNNTVSEKEESHRIWLNISNSNSFRQTLIGYIDGATNEDDRSYDGLTLSNSKTDLYSLLNEKPLNIQGRALPFDENDSVNLGYKTGFSGNQIIAIDHVDGIFTKNQGIYLEDKVLNIIHDLKQNPYEFTSEIGSFNNRFILRYTNPTLGVTNQNIKTGVNASIKNKKIAIQAPSNIISISIFDLTGKLIKTHTPNESDKHFEDDFLFAEGIYFAKIQLEDNSLVTKKLIN